jgi:hypothetical protein
MPTTRLYALNQRFQLFAHRGASAQAASGRADIRHKNMYLNNLTVRGEADSSPQGRLAFDPCGE